jgi:hypothetical protein
MRWRGRSSRREEQVANARDSFVDLTPVSEAPAVVVRSAWSAILPGQDVPLTWERTYGGEEED